MEDLEIEDLFFFVFVIIDEALKTLVPPRFAVVRERTRYQRRRFLLSDVSFQLVQWILTIGKQAGEVFGGLRALSGIPFIGPLVTEKDRSCQFPHIRRWIVEFG